MILTFKAPVILVIRKKFIMTINQLVPDINPNGRREDTIIEVASSSALVIAF